MSYDDDFDYDARWEYQQEEYETELVQKGLKEQRDEQIRDYLGVYGDAVQARIDSCLAEARSLLEHGFPSASMVRAVTGTELAIHYFVLRPVIGVAFLSEEWAAVLVKRVLKRESSSDRDLLPTVLAAWEIQLESIKLGDGSLLWKTFVESLVVKRNRVVHQGDVASDIHAQASFAVLEGFLESVVSPLSDRFGFSWSKTRKWSERQQGIGGAETSGTVEPASPFIGR